MTQFSVVSFTLSNTSVYQDKHIRGYNLNVNAQQLTELMERTNNGRVVTANSVNTTDPLIGLNSAVGENINLENGWNSQRSFFTLVIDETSALGMCNRFILSGFCNGVITNAYSEDLDPLGSLYFNSLIKLGGTVNQNGALTFRMESYDQILRWVNASNNMSGVTPQGFVNSSVAGRPIDVINLRQNMEFVAQEGLMQQYGNTMIHPTTMSGEGDAVVLNRNRNNLSNMYGANLLNSLKTGEVASFANDNTNYGVWNEASSSPTVNETAVSGNRILAQIAFSGLNKQELRIPLGTMMQSFPDINNPNVKMIIDTGPISEAAMNVSHNNGRSLEAVIAATISSYVPGLAGMCGIAFVDFTVTTVDNPFDGIPWEVIFNVSPDGYLNVNFLDAGIPQEEALDRFRTQVRDTLMQQLTANGTHFVTAGIICDLYKDTSITVQVNGGYQHTVVEGSFASGRFSPNIMSSGDELMGISDGVDRIHSSFEEAQYRQQSMGSTRR